MQVLPIAAAGVCDKPGWAFIIGAPRCATSSLARYLGNHPDICFSNVKEPHFFAAADLRGVPDADLRKFVQKEYVDRYFQERTTSAVLAEGSVTYLYVPEQLEPIVRLWPNAKFIIGVRNPLSMIPSLHRRLCYIGDETELDFERAWRLVPERRRGNAVPPRCIDPRWLDYWEAGQLGRYVERMLSRFGRERCFVYVYDDFVADPGRVYREALEFLDLPDDRQTHFPVHRESLGFRAKWLQHALMRPPGMMHLMGSKTLRRHLAAGSEVDSGPLVNALWSIRQRLLAWNKTAAPRVSLRPELRSEMARVFREDVALLGTLLGRDFSHWLDQRGVEARRSPRRSCPAFNQPELGNSTRAVS